jgi:Pentapeptide repeats (8 copies)
LILNHDLPVTRTAGVAYRAPGKAHLRVVTIARARTLVAVRRLDPSRQSTVVRFLIEAGLTREISLSVLPLEGDHLTGVDLAGADMQWANLSTADLRWTNLHGTDLRNAHLEGAHLQRASLQGARLAGAHMRGAALQGANLTGADLQGAQLVAADLKNAQLQGAQLAGADLQGARLDGARLVGKTSTKRTQLPAVFTEVNLTGVSWRGTWCPDGTRSALSTGGCAHHLSH